MVSPKDGDGEDEPTLEGPIYTNKEDEDDKNFVEVGPGELDVDFLEVEGGVLDVEAELKVVEVEVDASLVKVQFGDEIDTSKDDEDDEEITWVKVTIPERPPQIATVGSPTVHGTTLGPGIGSPNVNAGSKPVWRCFVDTHGCPVATPQPHGTGFVFPSGRPTVRVNGFPVARAGDVVLELMGGPNPILTGAHNVLAGLPAPPTTMMRPGAKAPKEEDGVLTKARKWIFDVDLKASVEVEADVLPGKHRVSGGAKADPLDGIWGLNGEVRTDGQVGKGKIQTRARLEGTFFGTKWDWPMFDWEKEGGFGEWGWGKGVYHDPYTKNTGTYDVDKEAEE